LNKRAFGYDTIPSGRKQNQENSFQNIDKRDKNFDGTSYISHSSPRTAMTENSKLQKQIEKL
jgi:hypothetical protein